MQDAPAKMTLPPNRISELRAARGLRLVHIGAALDVDQSTVYRWERGESAISDEVKHRLAAFFDVSIPFLMGWDEAEKTALPEPTEKAA